MSTWIRQLNPKDLLEDSKNQYRLNFIADYSGRRRLSFSEVEQAVRSETERLESFNTVPVSPFNTVEAGFALRQLAVETPRPENTFFYVNVAPRKDDKDSRENNEGEKLVYVELENGVPVVTTFSGHILSFIRDKIAKMRALDMPSHGSQFRSRDIFPEAVARVMEGDSSVFDGEVEIEIPELSESVVGYVDGFGNIKTTVRESEVKLEEGEKLEIEVSGSKHQITRSDGIFHIPEGELVYAPGSSGGEDSFMEIVLRGGNAAEKLGEPKPGDSIEFKT